MLLTEDYWHDKIASIGLPEMPIKKVFLQSSPKTTRNDMLTVSEKLLQFAFYSKMEDLAKASLPFEMVKIMSRGEFPENLSISLKTPIEYGGELAFSNMFLIQKYPYRPMLDKFYDLQREAYQRESGTQALPPEFFAFDPPGIVFLPALKGFSTAGGNATSDRMTESGSAIGAALASRGGNANG